MLKMSLVAVCIVSVFENFTWIGFVFVFLTSFYFKANYIFGKCNVTLQLFPSLKYISFHHDRLANHGKYLGTPLEGP